MATSDIMTLHRPSEDKTLGYVFGMFAVVTMIGIGLGAVFFIFGEGPKSSSGH